jgi:hypothetical protein
MRFWAFVVLAAMPLLLGAWTLSSEENWHPGRAVVKSPDGVSHVIRRSACTFGPRPRDGRLRFGGTAINSDAPYMSLAVETRKGSPRVLDIIDGVLRLAPNATIAVLGTAHGQIGPGRRGTFVLFKHKGGGVLGKARYTGSWNCS